MAFNQKTFPIYCNMHFYNSKVYRKAHKLCKIGIILFINPIYSISKVLSYNIGAKLCLQILFLYYKSQICFHVSQELLKAFYTIFFWL